LGAFQGGLTYRQYFVRGELPADWRDRFAERLREHAFKPVEPASEEERALGWCSPHFPLDVDLHEGIYLHNEYLVLSVRIDTLKVPGPILKIYTEAECRRTMAEQKVDSLNRYQRAEIKDRVTQELRRKILPSIKTVDMVWSLHTGRVRFWSGNTKLNEEFQELFEQTFELGLGADTPYTAAAFGILGVPEDVVEKLADLQPTPFATAAAGFVDYVVGDPEGDL
jgi:DNA recombination-dependent growth factor C